MPNSVRTQPIWLPTGNPDTTNISSTDFNAMGGQPASLGQKFDYNDREYQRVQLDSGAVAANTVGVVAANQLAYWKDKDSYLVTNDKRVALGGSLGTNAFNNFIAGVFRNATTAGNFTDILQKGDAVSMGTTGSIAAGQIMIGDVTASTAVAASIAVGTAPTYQRLGVARGAAVANVTSVDVEIDFEQF